MKIRLVLFVASLLAFAHTSVRAQTFLGSDTFLGSSLDPTNWQTSGTASFTVANGQLQFSLSSANLNSSARWKNITGSLDNDWVATVSTTLFYTGDSSTPSIGLLAGSGNSGGGSDGFFGIMLRGGQPAATTDLFSSTSPGLTFPSFAGLGGTVGLATTTTNVITDVQLRVSWNSSTGILASAYSLDSGATFLTSATANPTTAFGSAPVGFYLTLYANSGGTVPTGSQMFFDNFSVAATSAVPEPSTYAVLAGIGALGVALWRRKFGPARSA